MGIFIVIVLVSIAYIIWAISSQREEEKNQTWLREHRKGKELMVKRYPHLVGNVKSSWIETFHGQAGENGDRLLIISYLLYMKSVSIDSSEASLKLDNLWNLTKELFEHLEKYHAGSADEHGIAIAYYWHTAAEAVDKLTEINSESESAALDMEPFSNINKIVSFFPKKDNHPDTELSFYDENGTFPRESEGSAYIKNRLDEASLKECLLSKGREKPGPKIHHT